MAACVDKWPAAYPCRLPDKFYCALPDCTTTDRPVAPAPAASGSSGDYVWDALRAEAQDDADDEPLLRKFYHDLVLSRPSLEFALASLLAAKLCIPGALPQDQLRDLLAGALAAHPEAGRAARADLAAARDRDPACAKLVHCFLYYRGFLALQAHRAAHALWSDNRRAPALLLQSRASEVFGVDIHPGARIGGGILLDHATGVVIGEKAVVGYGVSILHAVTLGGTGKESGGTTAKPIIGKKAEPQRELPGVTMEQRWSD
uniref:Serine acetyltransferase N-terminal domain-containing protein n=1 Tax=Oryza nivara TaxID=4536 RepID=A0A0E0G2D1_ORYNI